MVVAAALPATVALGLRHLESQRRCSPTRGATDLPATPWWTKQDVLGELTGVTGYKPVALVKIDDNWTALRFKKT